MNLTKKLAEIQDFLNENPSVNADENPILFAQHMAFCQFVLNHAPHAFQNISNFKKFIESNPDESSNALRGINETLSRFQHNLINVHFSK